MKSLAFYFVSILVVPLLAAESAAGWESIVTHKHADGWEEISLNYAYDAADGWKWLPEAGVRAYIVEPDYDAERGFSEMVLLEGGMLTTDNALDSTVVDTFYIGRYEVTWGEWQAVRAWAAAKGYDMDSVGEGCADSHPVHSVTWYDVLKWCNAKSEIMGLAPVYRVEGVIYRVG